LSLAPNQRCQVPCPHGSAAHVCFSSRCVLYPREKSTTRLSRSPEMNTTKPCLTIALLTLGFALTATADDPSPSTPVADLVTAINQQGKTLQLIGNLESKLTKPGPEADQLAGELIGSLDQIIRHPEFRKYIQTLVDQKKDRLAAELMLRFNRAGFLGGTYGR